MMHATAGVQANLDFADEADAARKLRLALAASPITTALFANSTLSEGAPNGFESYPRRIWRHTDTDRWSLLPFAFEDGFGEGTAYRAYTEWALDVPMFLIVRDGHSLPARGQTFRHFMAHGHERLPAPRLVGLGRAPDHAVPRSAAEARGRDARHRRGAGRLGLRAARLLEGTASTTIRRSRPGSRACGAGPTREVDALHGEVARRGCRRAAPDGPVLEVARELVALSREGLRRQAVQQRAGPGRVDLPRAARADRGPRNAAPAGTCSTRGTARGSQAIPRLIEYAKY